MLSNILTLQTKDKVCVLSSLIVSILIACQINSKMTKTGRLSPGDPNSYSRPDIAKVTHIHLKLDINFDQQILDGLAILDVEKIDPKAQGQIISECPLEILDFPKIPKKFDRFLP